MTKEILASACRATVTVKRKRFNEVNLVLSATQAEADSECLKIGAKALRDGRCVTWSDGREQWVNVEADWIRAEDGSGDYVWHDDGNRVRCTRTLVTVSDGVRTEKCLGKSWRNYDLI